MNLIQIVGSAILIFLIFFYPTKINPTYYTLPEPRPLEGPLKQNRELQKAELLFKGQITGPESLCFHDGFLYTGLHNGKVVKLSIQDQKQISTFYLGNYSNECGTYYKEPECGRPLGIKAHPITGDLYVLDAYLGLFVIEKDTEKISHVLSQFNDTPFSFANDLIITKEGIIYFTESTTKYGRRDYPHEILESRALGRLFLYNPIEKSTTLVLDKLHFANGIEISHDEEFLLISESTRARILKYHLAGPKKGETEIFSSNLPGIPDNIRYDEINKVYWVGLATLRKSGSLLDILGPYPTIRRLISAFPQSLFVKLIPSYGIVIALDNQGQIIKSLQDPSGVVCWISEVAIHGDHLYMGSFRNDFIVSYKIGPDLFS